MKVIFLDIDGVLNDHTEQENRYCGTRQQNVSRFNRVLDAVPELQIVISSAWRYMLFRGEMSLRGFEMLLLTHGIKCHGRVIGHTDPDGRIEDEPHHHDERERWKIAGLKWRPMQIRAWLERNAVTQFVVVDDLPLNVPNLVQTDGHVGITDVEVQRIIQLFMRKPEL